MKKLFVALIASFSTLLTAAPNPRSLPQMLQAQLHQVQKERLGAFLVEASFEIVSADAPSSLNTFRGKYGVVGDDVHLQLLTTIWDGVNDEHYPSQGAYLAATNNGTARLESANLHPAVREVYLTLPRILAVMKESKHDFPTARVTLITIGRLRGRSPVYSEALASVPDDKSVAVVEELVGLGAEVFYIVIDASTGIPLTMGTHR